ncbi:mitochondrial 54S ribosomal protein mL58 MRPL20 [Sporobolomyces koalae]|uniref:mitochondrial 54S ribosomal protein mL58 MRPL20 n=1 Tax=Sporobolomyces koalae TaxID=500713 RepID=UPI003181802B
MYRLALNPTRAVLAPLRRTKDPLLASSVAQHFILPSGNSFIIRPPPSVLPPTVPIPTDSSSSSVATESHPFLTSIIESSSPLHDLAPNPALAQQLPNSRRTSPSRSAATLSADQVEQLHELRRTDASLSRAQLAKQFGISPRVVATLGYGTGREAKLAEKAKKQAIEAQRQEVEANWGWKKSIAREERRKRRSMW